MGILFTYLVSYDIGVDISINVSRCFFVSSQKSDLVFRHLAKNLKEVLLISTGESSGASNGGEGGGGGVAVDRHQCTCYECIYSDEDLRLLPPDISNLLHYEFPDNSSILRQVSSSKSPACTYFLVKNSIFLENGTE